VATKKNPTLAARIDAARAQLEETEARIGELSEELAAIPGQIAAVDWGDEEAAVLRVAHLERRRDALPHYLRHLKRCSAEQEITVLELEMKEAEARREPLHAAVEKAQAEFDQARQALAQANNHQHELLYGTISDLRRGITEARRRLAALDTEKLPEEKGPVVRSTWHQNMSRPGPENYAHAS